MATHFLTSLPETNMQILITKPIRKQLVANFEKAEAARATIDDDGNHEEFDFSPALKLFCPWGAATWLITELDPETNIAYGLAYLGGSTPELGLIPIDEIAAIRHPSGLRIERDIHFDARGKTLSYYTKVSRDAGYLVA